MKKILDNLDFKIYTILFLIVIFIITGANLLLQIDNTNITHDDKKPVPKIMIVEQDNFKQLVCSLNLKYYLIDYPHNTNLTGNFVLVKFNDKNKKYEYIKTIRSN